MFRLLVLSTAVTLSFCAPKFSAFRPTLDQRIVGGTDAFVEDFNHQCSVQYNGLHGCGCSLITDRHCVTAAHCTDGTSASTLSVRCGSSLREASGVVSQVSLFRQHPAFNKTTFASDISVLYFETPVNFTARIGTINLPVQDQQFAIGTAVNCTGWGSKFEGGLYSLILKVVNLAIVNTTECNADYGWDMILPSMICAYADGKDACQGDSGGPLSRDKLLVGVASWGYGCARPTYPGVYCNVANVRSFITEA